MTFKGADVGELNHLAADLFGAGILAAAEGVAVVTKGSHNVMTTARNLAPHGPHTPAYAFSITYDVAIELTAIEGEIGPDKDRPQGPLGNIFEFGTSEQPPQAHVGPAVDIENPKFYGFVAAIATKALW